MAVLDVTARDAVLDAIDEFDELGREAFLARYGFGSDPVHVVDYTGTRYDSLPLLASAHNAQHGQPLTPVDFVDATRDARQVLEKLGFRVIQLIEEAPVRRSRATATVRPATPTVRRVQAAPSTPALRHRPRVVGWPLAVGEVTNRAELVRLHGGSKFAPIDLSTRSPNICLFVEPGLSPFDGWDRADTGVYHVTGEGRSGDQRMVRGNKAVAEHERAGKTLRVFEAVEGRPTAGGRPQRYLGAFRVDPERPYRTEWADDPDGNQRQVLVFRLLCTDPEIVTPDTPAADIPDPS